MNNEIKEILHEMKQMCDVWVKVDGNMKSYNQDQIHKIYDYITNLQQENNNLKTSLDESQEVVIDLQQENERLKIDNKILKQNNINEVLRNDFDMCVKDLKKANKKIEKLEDYKSRIEKAVEYIKEQYKWIEESDKRWQPVLDNKKILNILNGRSDE